MKPGRMAILLVIVTALAGQPTQADDRPDNIRPWVPPSDIRSRVLDGLQPGAAPRLYEDRSAARRLPIVDDRNSRKTPRPSAPAVGRPYQDRSGQLARAREDSHVTFQYRSSLAGTRQRLERENRSDRRSFDRLQRLRREESRVRR